VVWGLGFVVLQVQPDDKYYTSGIAKQLQLQTTNSKSNSLWFEVYGFWFSRLSWQNKLYTSRMAKQLQTTNNKQQTTKATVYGLRFMVSGSPGSAGRIDCYFPNGEATTNDKQQTTNYLDSFHMLRQAPLLPE
jgi:hypothetical protein